MNGGEVIRPVTGDGGDQNKDSLKSEWMELLGKLRMTGRTLRELAYNALGIGIARKELIQWGVEAGFKESHMRTLVSKLCVSRGERERKFGGGPKVSPGALALLAYARGLYGAQAEKLLLAAGRAGRAELSEQKPKVKVASPEGAPFAEHSALIVDKDNALGVRSSLSAAAGAHAIVAGGAV